MSRRSLVILEWILLLFNSGQFLTVVYIYDFTQHWYSEFQYLCMCEFECEAPHCLQDSLNFLYYGYGIISSRHMCE